MSLIGYLALYIVLHFLFIDAIRRLREKNEGLDYNTSFGSEYGDKLLILVVVVGIHVLLRSGGWIYSGWWLAFALASAITGTIIGAKVLKPNEFADKYHLVFVIPAFVLLLVPMIPVLYYAGTVWEWLGGWACIAGWAVFVAYDVATGRINQRSWLQAQLYLFSSKR